MLVRQFGIHFNGAIKSIQFVPKCIMFDVVGSDDFWIKGHNDLISEPEIFYFIFIDYTIYSIIFLKCFKLLEAVHK